MSDMHKPETLGRFLVWFAGANVIIFGSIYIFDTFIAPATGRSTGVAMLSGYLMAQVLNWWRAV